jgi:endonuclease YncB( thermonuclease family)
MAMGLLSATTVAPAAAPEPITGQASVVDGDTIEIHRQRIRLFGIDAPESDQLCRGDDSLQHRCGAKAANDLDAFIAGRPVSCAPVSTDRLLANRRGLFNWRHRHCVVVGARRTSVRLAAVFKGQVCR